MTRICHLTMEHGIENVRVRVPRGEFLPRLEETVDCSIRFIKQDGCNFIRVTSVEMANLHITYPMNIFEQKNFPVYILDLKSEVASLEAKISEGELARRQLERVRNNCEHKWKPAVYDPVVSGGYTTSGDPPGTMGVDRRWPQWVPREEKPRWTRVCQVCGKVQRTAETQVTKVEPVFIEK